MRVYPISDNGSETIELKADGDGRYALVQRVKNPAYQLGDDVKVIIMNQEELLKLRRALVRSQLALRQIRRLIKK